MSTAPIAIDLLETAIHDWIEVATGIDGASIYFPETDQSGAYEPAPPCAMITFLSGPIPLSQAEIKKIQCSMIQRINVVDVGPGNVGINFYLGYDDEPTPIVYVAAPAETTESSAAGLLALLTSDLPTGVTAALDSDDSTRIIVTGSEDEPLFGCSPYSALTTVTALRERHVDLERTLARLTWRIEFRGLRMNGYMTAADLLARTVSRRKRFGDPLLHAAGWRYSGTLTSQPSIPSDREESRAVLDFALVGYMTAAFQAPALRHAGYELTI